MKFIQKFYWGLYLHLFFPRSPFHFYYTLRLYPVLIVFHIVKIIYLQLLFCSHFSKGTKISIPASRKICTLFIKWFYVSSFLFQHAWIFIRAFYVNLLKVKRKAIYSRAKLHTLKQLATQEGLMNHKIFKA